jgi:uncharacterized protein
MMFTFHGGVSVKKRHILGLSAILGTTVASVGTYFSERVLHIKKKDEQAIIDRDTKLKHIDPDKFSSLPKQEVSIPSPNGYEISAMVIRPYDSKRFVIFSHGVTESKMSSLKYVNLFLNRGFNAVIYDQRRHGKTGGDTTSYGYYEKFDLQAVVDWLFIEEGEDLLLGIHGESMGAATTLLYAGELNGRAHFYIVDCPFSDLEELLTYQTKCEFKYMPSKLILPIGNMFVKVRGGFSLNDVSPIAVVNRIKQPVLFIHSEKDDYILPYMTKDLYEQKKGEKMLFMAKNGGHAQSLNENREDYEKAIDQFLEKYVNL